MWNNFFPSDFRLSKNRKLKLKHDESGSGLKLLSEYTDSDMAIISNYGKKWNEVYAWITKYIRTHALQVNDIDIAGLRHKQYKELIRLFRPLGFYVKDSNVNISSHKVAIYNVFRHGNQYNGSYSKLLEYAEKL